MATSGVEEGPSTGDRRRGQRRGAVAESVCVDGVTCTALGGGGHVCVHTTHAPHIHARVYAHTHTHTLVTFYGIAEKDGVSFSSWNNVFWENTKADGLH